VYSKKGSGQYSRRPKLVKFEIEIPKREIEDLKKKHKIALADIRVTSDNQIKLYNAGREICFEAYRQTVKKLQEILKDPEVGF